MNAKGKVAPANIPIFPAHWDVTPQTPSSQAPDDYSAAQRAVFMGRPPSGFVPPAGSPFARDT
jgi:hypothetical protein